jgi:DNA-binding GntR family transcriptional regulator
VADRIKHLIISGELLPGQQARQDLLAARLAVSKVPVREALSQLAAEGLLTYQRNAGYSVTRLNEHDFDQIYLMRALLEGHLLAGLPAADAAQLREIEAINGKIVEAAASVDLPRMRAENQRFHFGVFSLSPDQMIVRELDRLWTAAMPYHAVYLYAEAGRARVIAEHAQMLRALRDGDNQRLVDLMKLHRQNGRQRVGIILRPAGT